MSGTRARLGAIVTVACALTLAACGSGGDQKGTIPTVTGQNLLTKLDQVRELVDQGQCSEAETTAISVQAAIAALPDTVDGDVQAALVQASGNLVTQTRDQCQEAPVGPSGETGFVPDQTDTTTTPPADTSTEPPATPTDPSPPADTPTDAPGNSENSNGKNGGNGNANGQGDSGGIETGG